MTKEPRDMVIRYWMTQFLLKLLYGVWPLLSAAEKAEVRLLKQDWAAWKARYDEIKHGKKS